MSDPVGPGPVQRRSGPVRVYPHDAHMQGARKDSLVDDAYRVLKASILDGTLPPGYQAVEQRIAEQLEMSRTPVHEAIIRLQHEGLVRVLPRRGVQVLPVSLSDMVEVYQLLVAMEGMAAVLLSQHPERSERVVRGMEMSTNQMERALKGGDLRGWAEADEQFHRLLVTECGNARLARVASSMADQAQRARALTLPHLPIPNASIDEHRHIISAIRAGDAPTARSAAEGHRNRAGSEILKAIERF